ncbi:MAG: nucleotide exchange factor GrpE [Lachnospira sp.]
MIYLTKHRKVGRRVSKNEEKNQELDETLEKSTDNSEDTVEAIDDEAPEADNEATDEAEDINAGDKKNPQAEIIADLQDRIKRQMAEFDNFRKRTEKEKSSMFEMGATDIIKKLLPIVDNFERGFKTVSDEQMEDPFVKGMDMVYKQMIKMLEDSGVSIIEAVGVEFNPDLHNAVMHVEDETVGENIIVEEFEKGYTYRDTVIRHSMVKVAN